MKNDDEERSFEDNKQMVENRLDIILEEHKIAVQFAGGSTNRTDLRLFLLLLGLGLGGFRLLVLGLHIQASALDSDI